MKEPEELQQGLEELCPAVYDAFPDLDLYMDQLLGLIARGRISFREKDKVTSAMVNNYVKDGILPRAEGKRYSREHVAQLTMLSRLKQVLCVKDAGALLNAWVDQRGQLECYQDFRAMVERAGAQTAAQLEGERDVLAIALELAVDSYVKKTVCEYLIDQLTPEVPEQKPKKKKHPDKENGKNSAITD